MYHRQIPQSIRYTKSNLKSLEQKFSILRNNVGKFVLQVSVINKLKHLKIVRHEIMQQLIKNSKFLTLISGIPYSLNTTNLIKVWSHQCECVLVHRLRRTQQMFTLYSKLWDDQALKLFFKRIIFRGRRRDLVFGALAAVGFNWEKNRITDEEMFKYSNDLEYALKLKEKTMCCSSNTDSNKEKEKDCAPTKQCQCEDGKQSLECFENWRVFIKKNDLIVWKRLHPSGHYEYKVYGSYSDVSAEDFLNVQIDTKYRKQWDTTAIKLEIIDTDPQQNSNTDIIYWEMLWPKLFSNRDYVFKRRYLVDNATKTVLLVNKCIEHPDYPEDKSKHRVHDYWSFMVIKPYRELNKAGIEFSLTYFDNPGVNLPAWITTWVAMRAMPDFLERLRKATKTYKNYCKLAGVKCIYVIDSVEKPITKTTPIKYTYFNEDIVTDNTIFEAQYNICSLNRDEKLTINDEIVQNREFDDKDISNNPDILQTGNQEGFWKYLHITYYFS